MSQSGSERRQWARVPAEALTRITASVVAGPKVRLVNLSRGGALMEVASRFPMRSRVRLKLTLDNGEVTVAEGVVAWARVAAIVDKQVNYLVAVIFDKTIPDLGGMDVQSTRDAVAEPAAEEEPGPALTPVRDNLTRFPTPAVREPEPVPAVNVWNDADEHVVSLDSDEEQIAEAVSQSADHVASLSTSNNSLSTQLAAAAAECQTLRDHLETERRIKDEERTNLLQELAAAAANMAALQDALAAREHEAARARAQLAEALGRLEAGQSGLSALEREQSQRQANCTEQQTRFDAL